MSATVRYALEHPAYAPGSAPIRFAPEVGDLVGFLSPEVAMLHIFELLPETAHEWSWVPVPQSTKGE